MSEFTEDKAFRVLLVIGLFGMIFWSTYGHIMAYYEDSITEVHGNKAWEEGIKMGHLHGLSNSLVAAVASIALPLIKSIRSRPKAFLAAVLGLSLFSFNLGYTYAALTTAAPTEQAFDSSRVVALNWFIVPISVLASIVGGILFIALVYDLISKKDISRYAKP